MSVSFFLILGIFCIFSWFYPKWYLQKSQGFCVILSAPKRFTGIIICPGTVIFTFHFLKGGLIFQTLIHTFFKCARGEIKVLWNGQGTQIQNPGGSSLAVVITRDCLSLLHNGLYWTPIIVSNPTPQQIQMWDWFSPTRVFFLQKTTKGLISPGGGGSVYPQGLPPLIYSELWGFTLIVTPFWISLFLNGSWKIGRLEIELTLFAFVMPKCLIGPVLIREA